MLEAFGGYLLEEKRGTVPHKLPPLKILLGKTQYLMPLAFAVWESIYSIQMQTENLIFVHFVNKFFRWN